MKTTKTKRLKKNRVKPHLKMVHSEDLI